MKLELPDITDVLVNIMEVKSVFDCRTQRIENWISDNNRGIQNNMSFLEDKTEKGYLKIISVFVKDLLNRATSGETGMKIFYQFQKLVKNKDDLNLDTYRQIVRNAGYRWGVDAGSQVIDDAIKIIKEDFKGDWKNYFSDAEQHKMSNFIKDPFFENKQCQFQGAGSCIIQF